MIQTKKLIPSVYSQSYDMSLFTGILDLIYTSREIDILRQKNCHSPMFCFDEDVSRIGTFFGFEHISNRELFANYRMCLKQKGTKDTVLALVQFAAGLTPAVEGDNLKVKINKSDRVIEVYLDVSQLNSELLDTLIDKLAPIGVFIVVKPLAEYQS